MGYEILYHFYPRKSDDNKYDTDSPQVFTKHLGKMEEVAVEKLASAIMMQLARRDVMIFDVEIYEFTKRKISFKETKGGILVKNKKFMLDGSIEGVTEIPDDEIFPVSQPIVALQQQEKQPNQAIRWEVFDPDPMAVPMLMRKFKLSQRRKYPIIAEKTVMQKINVDGNMTEMPCYEYLIIDDAGQKVQIPSMHFTPEQKGLIGMEQMRMTESDYENMPKLMHMTQHTNDMPVIRR